ncbi:hypothetical protein J6590_002488 [Homalodisca vitripennis]|nr:hypothetical protein J6590_002488 [Homalodisca vitripennis]
MRASPIVHFITSLESDLLRVRHNSDSSEQIPSSCDVWLAGIRAPYRELLADRYWTINYGARPAAGIVAIVATGPGHYVIGCVYTLTDN